MNDNATRAPEVPGWVRDLYDLVDAGELDTYLERHYADDAEVTFASNPTARGKAAIREALVHGHDAHDMDHTIRNLWQAGDTTIVEFDVTYTFRDGSTIDTTSLAILDREDGLVKRMRVYIDHAPVRERAEAVAAAQ